MPVTSNTLVNRAVQLIGDDQKPVTGEYPTFDSSAAGKAANALYLGVCQTVARMFGWDFSRNVADLSVTTNTPPMGFLYEYLYPTNGIQVRQIMPADADLDLNDPLPVNWVVGNTSVTINAVPTIKKVIWANVQNARAVFTNQPPEDLWDSLFQEEVVRLLASELGMALAGKPETSAQMLETSNAFAQVAVTRDS